MWGGNGVMKRIFLIGAILTGILLFPSVASAEPVTVSVADYGAVGDGVADDQGAIASAIGYVDSNPDGGTVVFPSGTYFLKNGHGALLNNADNLTLLFEDGAKLTADCGSALRITGNTHDITVIGTVELIGSYGHLILEGGNAQAEEGGVRDITFRGNIIAEGNVDLGAHSHSVANITVSGTVQSGGNLSVAGTDILLGDITAAGSVSIFNSFCGDGRYGYTDYVTTGDIRAEGDVSFGIYGLRTDGTAGDEVFTKTNPTKVDHITVGDITAAGKFSIDGAANVKTGDVTLTTAGKSVLIQSNLYGDADGAAQFAPITNIEIGSITAEGSLEIYGAHNYAGTVPNCSDLAVNNIKMKKVILNGGTAILYHLRGFTADSISSIHAGGFGVILYNIADAVMGEITVTEPFYDLELTGVLSAFLADRTVNLAVGDYRFRYSGTSPYVRSMSIGGGGEDFTGRNILIEHAVADFRGSIEGDGLNNQTGPYAPQNVRYYYQYRHSESDEYLSVGMPVEDTFFSGGMSPEEGVCSATLYNVNDTVAAVTLIWAAYRADGSLLDTKVARDYIRPFCEGKSTIFRSPEGFAAQEGAEQIKLFLWDGVSGLQPITESFSYPAEQPGRVAVSPAVSAYTIGATEKNGGYEFTYADGEETVTYFYQPQRGGLKDITVSVNGSAAQQAVNDGISFPVEAFLAESRVSFDGKTVYTDEVYRDAEGTELVTLHYRLYLSGRSLVMEMAASNDAVLSYNYEALLDADIPVPYMPHFVNIGEKGDNFLSFFNDWTFGDASNIDPRYIYYGQLTNGVRRPLRERFLLTASAAVNNVFPTIPNTPSPYRSTMADRMVLDWWGHSEERAQFGYMDEFTDYLYDYGLRDIVFIRHIWQRDGYDINLPTSYPANTAYGGDAELIPFGGKMKEYGWIHSLHTNYTDYSPGYEGYNPEHSVKNSDGSLKIGGFHGEVWNNIMSPSRYQYYIDLLEPEINRRYATTASFVDVLAARGAGRDVDYNASVAGAGTHRMEFDETAAAAARLQEIHGGPLLTEGGWDHARYAGIIDGAEAQVAEATGEQRGGEMVKLMPDFELEKVFPLTLNHGMGYYCRWRAEVAGDHLLERLYLDKYRAQQVAYGHGSYVEDRLPIQNVSEVLKEYFYMLPIQKQYASSKAESVAYANAKGEEQTLSEALRSGYYTNDEERLKITYQNGTVIYINMEAENWTVDGKVIPQYGFYVKNDTFEAGTLLLGSEIGDYMVSEEQAYFEPRTTRKEYGTLDIRPELTSVSLTKAPTETENGQATLRFRWEINELLPSEATGIILHGTSNSDHIVGDYPIPDPMRTISAGTYNTQSVFVIDKDNFRFGEFYQIGTTLRNANAGLNDRYAIEGYRDNGALSILGSFRLVKEDDGSISVDYLPYAEDRANPAGEMVDFGGVSANEMFTAERAADGSWYITVLPRHRRLTLSFENGSTITEIYALDEEGEIIEEVIPEGNTVTLQTAGAYRYCFKGDIHWK